MLNQARLKVLKARDDHVSSVLDDARKQLATIAKDGSKYPKIMEGLIAQVGTLLDQLRPTCLTRFNLFQGLCQLLESQVMIRCRAADKSIVEAAIDPAIKSVRDKIKRDCTVKVDGENFLPADW